MWRAVDLLYPPRCAGCGQPGARWCADCQAHVKRMDQAICQRCGDRVLAGFTVCERCRQTPPEFEQLRSWGLYEGSLRKAIHRFKFDHDLSLAEDFSQHLHDLLQGQNWVIDVIVPAPLHRANQRARGFNQAAALASALSLRSGVPAGKRVLTWCKEVRTQVGLTQQQRLDNVNKAMNANSSIIIGKNILVIDDITTTGATINECARACKEAGAAKVYGLTLARAVFTREPEREENR